MTDLTAAWASLMEAALAARGRRIVSLFGAETQRLRRLGVSAAGLDLDLSKQPWSLADLEVAQAVRDQREKDRDW